MKRKVLLCVCLALLLPLLCACQLRVSFIFREDKANIREIALLYINDENRKDITVLEILPESQIEQFVEDFCDMTCYRRWSEPSSPGSANGLTIRFTYEDGIYELVCWESVDNYSLTGALLHRSIREDYYFDRSDFNEFILQYFPNINQLQDS